MDYQPRCEDRQRLSIPAELRFAMTLRSAAEVTDLSAHGCRIRRCSYPFEPGTPVFVRLEGLAPIRGTVRWYQVDESGIEFDQPLYLPVLEHLLAQWPQAASARGRSAGPALTAAFQLGPAASP